MNLMASQIEIVSMIEKLGSLENITNPKTVQNINKALTELSRSSNPAIIQKVIAFKERMERNPIHQQIKAEEVAKVKEVETKAVEKREEDLQHRRAVNVERAREEKKDKEEKAKETDFKAMMNGFNALPVWRQLDILDKVFERYDELNIDERMEFLSAGLEVAKKALNEGDVKTAKRIATNATNVLIKEAEQQKPTKESNDEFFERNAQLEEKTKEYVKLSKDINDPNVVEIQEKLAKFFNFWADFKKNHEYVAKNYRIDERDDGYHFIDKNGKDYLIKPNDFFDEKGNAINNVPQELIEVQQGMKENNVFLIKDIEWTRQDSIKITLEKIGERLQKEKEIIPSSQARYKNALDVISEINTLHQNADNFIRDLEKDGIIAIKGHDNSRKIFNDEIFSSLLKLDADKVMTVHELVKKYIRGESNGILALPFIRELLEKGEHEKERAELLKDILKNQWWGEEAASKIIESLKREVNSIDLEDKVKEAQKEMRAIDINVWRKNYVSSKTMDGLLNFMQHDLVSTIQKIDPNYKPEKRLDLLRECKTPEEVIERICKKMKEYGVEYDDEELKKAFETYLTKTGIGNSNKQELKEIVDHVYESYLEMKEVGKVNVISYEENTQLKHEGGVDMELAKLPDYIENAKNTMKDYPEYFTPHDPKEELKMENELEMERQNKAQNA